MSNRQLAPANGLNEVQLTLLRLFNRQMKEEEVIEIQDLLVNHLSQKLHIQVEKDIEQKGITRKDFDRILRRSKRTQKL
jgi:hypothetical protein